MTGLALELRRDRRKGSFENSGGQYLDFVRAGTRRGESRTERERKGGSKSA